MALDYIKIEFTWTEVTQTLTDAERGRLVDDLVRYARDGVEPEDFRGNERYVFPLLKAQIDKEKQGRERKAASSRKNGCKGGRPKKSGTSEKTQENPKNPVGSLGFQKNPNNLSGFLGYEEQAENADIAAISPDSSKNPKNPAGFLGFEDAPISGGSGGNSFELDNPYGETKETREEPTRNSDGSTITGVTEPRAIPLQDYVQQNLFHLSPGNWVVLRELMADGISDALVRRAIDNATKDGKRTWAYVQSILNRWLCEGVRTLEDVERDEAKHKARIASRQRKSTRQRGAPRELPDDVNPFAEV